VRQIALPGREQLQKSCGYLIEKRGFEEWGRVWFIVGSLRFKGAVKG